LKKELRGFDSDVLSFADRRGIRMQVTNTETEVFKMLQDRGNLTTTTADRVDTGAARRFGESLATDPRAAAIDQKIASLESRRKELFGDQQPLVGFGIMGGVMAGAAMKPSGPPTKGIDAKQPSEPPQVPPKMQEAMALNGELMKLSEEKGKLIDARSREAGVPVRSGTMFAGQMSSDMMAEFQGAKTPAEKQQFEKMMGAVNGDRLQAARRESLRNIESLAARMDNPKMKGMLGKQLDDMRAHPEKIPMDRVKHNILIPDVHYYRPGGKGEAVLLDSENLERANKHVDGASGLYFSGTKTAQVDAAAVGRDGHTHGTASHELSHGLDYEVAAAVPAFYKTWSADLEKAYAQAKTRGASITEYALTNPREYVAEGVEHYHRDRALLKTRDPALHDVAERLLQQAGKLGVQ